MKRDRPEIVFNIINYLIFTIILFICIYPFYYLLIYSLSDPTQAQKGVFLIPAGFTLRSYITVFNLNGIGHAAMISVFRTVIGTGVTVFCCSFFAYILTKQELYYRKTIYRLVVVTMYLNAGLIPWYLTMKYLMLKNTFWVYIIPFAVSAYYIVLIKTFIEQLPPSLEESAKIDGADYFTVFSRIIFPLSMPIIATITVFAAVTQWNQWFDNFILVQNENLKTLQLILYNYLNESSNIAALVKTQNFANGKPQFTITPQTIQMTMTMVVTLPVIFIYPFLQRFFVKGIMLGAIKG